MLNEIPLTIVASLLAALIALSSWILRLERGMTASALMVLGLGLAVFAGLTLLNVAAELSLYPAMPLLGAGASVIGAALFLRRASA